MRKLIAGLIGLLVLTSAVQAAQEEQLRLVPFPKELQLKSGQFSLGKRLALEITIPEGELFARVLNEELERAGLPPVVLRQAASGQPVFRLRSELTGPSPSLQHSNTPFLDPNSPEAYSLEVRADGIVCGAREAAGLFYGLQTLCQLIRANRQGDALPCLAIRDWPSLRWRCLQDDMTRGPSSTLETLKTEAALGSFLKLNLMTYYMEHQFAFKKHPRIGPPNGSLTPEDLSALVAYAKPLRVDILGNQQSFGHFTDILKHPEYAALRETPYIVSPAREETYRLLDDLYSEVCPLLPFPWFNVCCDETDGLGTGPSREMAARIGIGGVYVGHIRRLHDLLRDKHHKRMMMWGDIILQHPDQLAQVPKDTIMLSWGYDARASFEEQIVPFAKSGYEFFVCPGVNNWSRILPDFGVAVTNIQHFVRDGVKHGALGMINTDWEDDGEAINAVKWHADAWAAECAWNASRTSFEAFNRRVGAVLFGERGDHFGRAIVSLAGTHRLQAAGGMFNSLFWEWDFAPKSSTTSIQSAATNLLALVRPAVIDLAACRQEARCNQHILEAFLFGARRMELIGQRRLDGLAAARLYEDACANPPGLEKLAQAEQLVGTNRDAHEALGRQFAKLWLAENKPYALDWTLRRYTNTVSQYQALLDRLTAARKGAIAGQALPDPEAMGLAVFRPLFRRVRPSAVVPAPLAPERPWAVPAATHRIGVAISAGGVQRFDLPVEIELSLPNDLATRPVRAFLLETNGEQREVIAQLDALGLPGKARLVLVLPGALPAQAGATVLVYLGSPEAPQPLPTAVRPSAGPNGMQWIENDRVRLLLGPEGSHIYRWEVKAASNRDLTMPGETDWAGFCDIISRRHTPYRLDCTAHGPAMVEFQAGDAAGHTKTVRLYAGASWVEVFLGEPTGMYWDYDDPKSFAADGPTPGTWLFSDGQSGAVGRQADGASGQVRAGNTFWGMKYNPAKLALGLLTPEVAGTHLVAPGAGWGGVGIEGSASAGHFVTFGGVLEAAPRETMERLQATLNLKKPVQVQVHALQQKKP